MDNQDRQAIEGLFSRLAGVEQQAGPRDAAAEAFIKERVSQQTAAPYFMAQTIVMQDYALQQAQQTTEADTRAMHASEDTINQVVQQVDGAVSQLHDRAAEQTAQGELVKDQVQQLLIAFQFQDRVHQIMDQLRASMTAAVESLSGDLRQGRIPDAQAWQALLGQGYTTAEQRAVSRGQPVPAKPQAAVETTFF